jgi:hypothetical protein
MGNPYVFGGATTNSGSAVEMHTSDAAGQTNITAYDPQIDGSVDYYQRSLPANLRNDIGHASQPRNTYQHQHQGQHQHQHRTQSHSQHQAPTLHRQQHAPTSAPSQVPPPPRPDSRATASTVTTLLPYCTTGPSLRQDQVIALSDIVGSLKELVLLVQGAATGDAKCEEKLVGAVGTETASNIVRFFVDEWETE